jgi:hypothetical protein
MDDAPHALGGFQRTGGTVDADGAPSPGTSGHGLPARIDPAGDFLSVYTGPLNGDLDVTAFDAVLSVPDEVVLVGTHAAPIGTTPGRPMCGASTAAPASNSSRRSIRPRAKA